MTMPHNTPFGKDSPDTDVCGDIDALVGSIEHGKELDDWCQRVDRREAQMAEWRDELARTDDEAEDGEGAPRHD